MSRDRRRFEQLVAAHAGAVTAYARAMTNDRWAADDAVQETFLRAWKYLDSFRGNGSFEGWLIRICHNCVIDLARGRTDTPDDRLPDHAQAPDHSSEVHDLIERLPAEQREVVALCGVLGYDYAAAAAILDVPVGTIRSRLHRARAALERELTVTNERVIA
ncbi:MAG: RNA polymerase sigma factor [Acidimicrobiia bacterium]